MSVASRCLEVTMGQSSRTLSLKHIFPQKEFHRTSLSQNRVVERKNRTLVEAFRTMLNASSLPISFWAEAISTACFIQSRSPVIKRHEKTPNHILHGRNPKIKYSHVFACTCHVFNDRDHLKKQMKQNSLDNP